MPSLVFPDGCLIIMRNIVTQLVRDKILENDRNLIQSELIMLL
jgi:hypothetical protein